MLEGAGFFDLNLICPKCGEVIDEGSYMTAVIIRTWNPNICQHVDEGPFHAECGKIRQNEISSTLHK